MPFDKDTFDLAVASMSLMNMDEPGAVVREVARVLGPGSRFCFSVVHPVNSWGDTGGGYFDVVRYREVIERNGASLTLNDTHHPLGGYLDLITGAGFLVERLVEPVPDDAYVAAVPRAERWRRTPGFLHGRAVLPAA
jgi:SAM-dependent methyltransferase